MSDRKRGTTLSCNNTDTIFIAFDICSSFQINYWFKRNVQFHFLFKPCLFVKWCLNIFFSLGALNFITFSFSNKTNHTYSFVKTQPPIMASHAHHHAILLNVSTCFNFTFNQVLKRDSIMIRYLYTRTSRFNLNRSFWPQIPENNYIQPIFVRPYAFKKIFFIYMYKKSFF